MTNPVKNKKTLFLPSGKNQTASVIWPKSTTEAGVIKYRMPAGKHGNNKKRPVIWACSPLGQRGKGYVKVEGIPSFKGCRRAARTQVNRASQVAPGYLLILTQFQQSNRLLKQISNETRSNYVDKKKKTNPKNSFFFSSSRLQQKLPDAPKQSSAICWQNCHSSAYFLTFISIILSLCCATSPDWHFWRATRAFAVVRQTLSDNSALVGMSNLRGPQRYNTSAEGRGCTEMLTSPVFVPFQIILSLV